MSFTSIRNDSNRLIKEAQIFSFPGKYALDVPGQGTQLPYIEDPHIRLEKWGANSMTNIIQLESNLKGLSQKLKRDTEEYKTLVPPSTKINSGKSSICITEESRASCPAFMFRGMEIPRWEQPFLNPQANVEIPCMTNVQTRILDKDFKHSIETEMHPEYWLPFNPTN